MAATLAEGIFIAQKIQKFKICATVDTEHFSDVRNSLKINVRTQVRKLRESRPRAAPWAKAKAGRPHHKANNSTVTMQGHNVRPHWWRGVDGAEPKLPEARDEFGTLADLDGFVLEEIIWNWKNNPFYATRDIDSFFNKGNSPSHQIMNRWNEHKEAWIGLHRHEIPCGMPGGFQASWKRYHDYLDAGGDPIVHDLKAQRPKHKKHRTGNGCETCAARACSIPRQSCIIPRQPSH